MRSRRIGLALDLGWPYRRHLDVFAGTQQYGREASGWTFEIDEFIQERLRGAGSRRRPYDGLIARATPELAAAARRAGVPLVNTWFNSPVREDLPGVFPDFSAIGRLAGEHLAERGFRRFGCLGVRGETGTRIVSTAFHRVLRGLGCGCNCARTSREYRRTSRSWSRFQEGLDAWIDSWTPPVGLLVAYHDTTARYVVSACQRRGLKVPEDVALITPSNEPHVSVMPPPSISSVEINYLQVGFRAARMLDLLMRGKRLPIQQELLQPAGVIARDSTDYFAMEDPDVATAMRFIERNLVRKIGVQDVVAGAAVSSRRRLERRFRDTCGRSIAAEIRRLRVLKAKRLLSETALLVKQVAKESGFGDPIRLHEVFVREVGMAPGAYRERATTGG
jgi:LacI family transcriptional regulator